MQDAGAVVESEAEGVMEAEASLDVDGTLVVDETVEGAPDTESEPVELAPEVVISEEAVEVAVEDTTDREVVISLLSIEEETEADVDAETDEDVALTTWLETLLVVVVSGAAPSIVRSSRSNPDSAACLLNLLEGTALGHSTFNESVGVIALESAV